MDKYYIDWTEDEIKELEALGLEPCCWWCDINKGTDVKKLKQGYDIWEPHVYYDTEHDRQEGSSIHWIETFDELIIDLKKRLRIK